MNKKTDANGICSGVKLIIFYLSITRPSRLHYKTLEWHVEQLAVAVKHILCLKKECLNASFQNCVLSHCK